MTRKQTQLCEEKYDKYDIDKALCIMIWLKNMYPVVRIILSYYQYSVFFSVLFTSTDTVYITRAV